jgi:lipopolysaccharide export system permease protein
MGSISRYIFRTTITAFLLVLVSLTMAIWFTQAMRDFDLITTQRQTLLVFIGITGLVIPLLVMLIAPIALALAAAHVLNRLGADSEIVVMNAAGISPWRLLWPFVAAGLLVSLLVAFIAAYLSPLSMRELRTWSEQVRADILTNIVQPGRFTSVGGLTFHIADRRPGGQLIGIFVDDHSSGHEHATYLAESGEIVKNKHGSFLVLEHGSIQRIEPSHRDPRIVTFDRYAFDLSKFMGGPQSVKYNVREKFLWDLIWPQPGDALYAAQPSQYRSEISDRLASPLYPLAFIILTYMFLGPPQTARQNHGLALVGLIISATALRLAGFFSVIVGVRAPDFLALQFIALFGTIAVGLWQISRGRAMEHASVLTGFGQMFAERIARAVAS